MKKQLMLGLLVAGMCVNFNTEAHSGLTPAERRKKIKHMKVESEEDMNSLIDLWAETDHPDEIKAAQKQQEELLRKVVDLMEAAKQKQEQENPTMAENKKPDNGVIVDLGDAVVVKKETWTNYLKRKVMFWKRDYK